MQLRLLQDKKQTGPLCYIIEAALEYFISLMVTGAYLARITGSLGFSDSLTGILSSFVSLGCVFQLGAIRLFRNSATVKRTIILSHLINQALFACVYFIPALPLANGVKTTLFLLCFCGAYIISNIIVPPKSSWLISLISDRERGVFTARKEIVSLLSGMIFTYFLGHLTDRLEAAGQQRLSFLLGGVIILALMVLHTLSLVPIEEKPRSAGAKSVNKTGVSPFRASSSRTLRTLVIKACNVDGAIANCFSSPSPTIACAKFCSHSGDSGTKDMIPNSLAYAFDN